MHDKLIVRGMKGCRNHEAARMPYTTVEDAIVPSHCIINFPRSYSFSSGALFVGTDYQVASTGFGQLFDRHSKEEFPTTILRSFSQDTERGHDLNHHLPKLAAKLSHFLFIKQDPYQILRKALFPTPLQKIPLLYCVRDAEYFYNAQLIRSGKNMITRV